MTGLVGRARARVIEAASTLKDEAVRAAMTRAFGDAEAKAAQLRGAADALRGARRLGEELLSRVEGAAREASASVARLRADEAERARMREELRAGIMPAEAEPGRRSTAEVDRSLGMYDIGGGDDDDDG